MKKRIVSVVLVLAMAATCFIACGKEEEVEPTETQIVVETEEVDPHEGFVQCDLCGEWVTPEEGALRPIAMMIENTNECQPQYGVSQADIIYECPVEGAITRMMAIFKNYKGMEKTGNIRSCRHYFAYFAHEYDSIYVHAGASDYADNGVLAQNYIEDIDAIKGKFEPYVHRDSSEHKAPHNLYTSSEELENCIKEIGFRDVLNDDYESHFTFCGDDETITLDNGTPATKVSMYYQLNKPWFEYNEQDGLYYRYEFKKEHMDGLTNTQLAVTNIIIQDCEITPLYGELLDIKFTGTGTGYYITQGKAVPITWKRDSENDITHYYYENGDELVMNPGKTWIEISANDKADKNVIE